MKRREAVRGAGAPVYALAGGGLGLGLLAAEIAPGDPTLYLGLLAPAVALVATVRRAGSPALSPAVLFVGLYVVLIHVGALLFYQESPRDARFVTVSSWALLSFAAGTVLMGTIGRRSRCQVVPVRDDDVEERVVVWKMVAVAVVAVTLLFILAASRKAGGIPVIGLLRGQFVGEARDFTYARLDFTAGVGGQGYLYNVYSSALPATALVFLLGYLHNRRTSYKRWAALLGVLSFIAAVVAGYRSPTLVLAIMLFVGLSYYRHGFSTRGARWAALLASATVVVITSVGYVGQADEPSLQGMLVARVFKVQGIGAQFVYRNVPDQLPFTGGDQLVDDLAGVLPGRDESFTSRLPSLRHAKSLSNPIGVVAELYMNFGVPGVVLGMVPFAAVCDWLHTWAIQRRRLSDVAIAAVLATAVAQAAISGTVGVIFQRGVIAALLLRGLVSFLHLRGHPDRKPASASRLVNIPSAVST